MTDEQRQEFLDKVRELVSEHCNGYIFIADVDHDEYMEGMAESVMMCDWGGGITMVTGLLHRATKRIEREDAENEKNHEED